MDFFAGLFERNTRGGQWIVGSKVSLADVALFHHFDFFDDQESVQRALEIYPVLKELRERVRTLLAEYIANRPESSV